MCIDLFLRIELLDLKIITLFIFQFSFLSALLEHFYWRPWIIMIENHRIFLAETSFLIWSRKWYLIYICIPILIIFNIFHQVYYRSCTFSFFFLYFINIVLVLPYINMNPPQVYTCSPSWILLPPPSLYHPSGSSQCTSRSYFQILKSHLVIFLNILNYLHGQILNRTFNHSICYTIYLPQYKCCHGFLINRYIYMSRYIYICVCVYL